MKKAYSIFLLLFLIFNQTHSQNKINNLLSEIDSGKIIYKLSEPEELTNLLGEAKSDSTLKDGGMLVRIISFENSIETIFGKFRNNIFRYSYLNCSYAISVIRIIGSYF